MNFDPGMVLAVGLLVFLEKFPKWLSLLVGVIDIELEVVLLIKDRGDDWTEAID